MVAPGDGCNSGKLCNSGECYLIGMINFSILAANLRLSIVVKRLRYFSWCISLEWIKVLNRLAASDHRKIGQALIWLGFKYCMRFSQGWMIHIGRIAAWVDKILISCVIVPYT